MDKVDYKLSSYDLDILQGYGYSTKFWVDENGKQYLIKIDTPLHESLNEYASSQLALAFGIDCVVYEKIKVDLDGYGYSAIKCESYIKENDEEHTVYDIIREFPKQKLLSAEKFIWLLDRLSEKTGEDKEYLRNGLLKIATFDYIVCNLDRHLNNIVLLKSDKGYRFSPLFDFGRTFAGAKDIRTDSDIQSRLREYYTINKSIMKEIQDMDIDYSKKLVNEWIDTCNGYKGIDNLDIDLGYKKLIKYRIKQILSL
jgi:hipA-like C-terminal domain